MENIADNYKRIQDTIAHACAMAHRDTSEITLLAVTKFVPVERIALAVELGIRDVGENRAQDFCDKLDFFEKNGFRPHFIGQLQTNKVKYIIGKAVLIQSVDRLELAREIARQAQHQDVVQDILVEVNIGGEAQKGGIGEHALPALLQELHGMPQIRVQGLMCVPPALNGEQARPYFARMRELFEACKEDGGMRHLSMGMSGDYAAAIAEGATMVRVGSALFGARQYTIP